MACYIIQKQSAGCVKLRLISSPIHGAVSLGGIAFKPCGGAVLHVAQECHHRPPATAERPMADIPARHRGRALSVNVSRIMCTDTISIAVWPQPPAPLAQLTNCTPPLRLPFPLFSAQPRG